MRRSSLAPRIVALAFASGAIALAGCPAEVAGPPKDVVEIDIVEVDVADPNGPSSTTSGSPDATERRPPSVETDGSSASTASAVVAPAVTIERPKDFLHPTLPDAALRDDKEEPVAPPVEITDRSAEATDPNYLPGGTPIDDLFEGLEEKPSGASKD